MIMRKIIEEWKPLPDKNIYILTLDKTVIIKNAKDDFHNYRIDGKVYKPVPMSPSLSGTKCITVKGEGGFVGKTVEFVKDTDEINERIAV